MNSPRALAAVLLALAALSALAQEPAAPRSTRHALIIGIGEYNDTNVPELRGVTHDMASARRMAAAMEIGESNITMLRDGDATAARIRAEIAALAGRIQGGDRVFLYYSGHGTRTYDKTVSADGCVEGILTADGRSLTNVELGQRLAPLAQRADKMLVFYDACFSGGFAGAPARTRGAQVGQDVITPKFVRTASSEACSRPTNVRTRSVGLVMQMLEAPPQNVVHVAASRPDEVSFDSSTRGGVATSAWRDCLLGEARDLDRSGAVTIDEVTRCAQEKISHTLADVPGVLGQQMTVYGNARFVPAWMGASPPPASATASTPVSAPGARPDEILAELFGQRDGARAVSVTTRRPRLKIGGDALEFEVTPARDGYLYVALAGSDGQSLSLLFPNDLASDNRVFAGRRVVLPGKGWEVVAGGPPGTETLLVMVTDAPRDLSRLPSEKDGPFMKTLLDDRGRSRLQAILSNGTPARGCGAAHAGSCSDAFGAALLKVETVR